MLPLPMNEFLQQSLRENCGVEVAFEVVEWNTLLAGLRAEPTQPQWLGADALNISLVLLRPLGRGAVVPVVQRHAARLQRRPLA